MKIIITFLSIILFSIYSHAQQWVNAYNGTTDGMAAIKSMVADNFGNVYILGYSHLAGGDMITVKYDPQGERLWAERFPVTTHSSINDGAIYVDEGGNVYVSNTSMGSGFNPELVLVKYNMAGHRVEYWPGDALGIVMSYHRLLDYSGFRIFPNPAKNFFTIELPYGQTYEVSIADVSGKVVLGEITISEEKEIDCSSLPNGIYFLSVMNDNQVVFTDKVVVQN